MQSLGKFLIVHNQECSKSRGALEILQAHGIQPQIIDYLHGGLSRELLMKVIEAGIPPKELIRTKEEEFQKLSINLNNAHEVIDAILIYPILLERPIVMKDQKAVIGRPPENVLTLLK